MRWENETMFFHTKKSPIFISFTGFVTGMQAQLSVSTGIDSPIGEYQLVDYLPKSMQIWQLMGFHVIHENAELMVHQERKMFWQQLLETLQ